MLCKPFFVENKLQNLHDVHFFLVKQKHPVLSQKQ